VSGNQTSPGGGAGGGAGSPGGTANQPAGAGGAGGGAGGAAAVPDGGGVAPKGDGGTAPPPSPSNNPPAMVSGPELGYPGSPPRTPAWGFIHIFESHSSLQGRHEFDFFKDAVRPACQFKEIGPCMVRTCPGGEGTKGVEVSAGKVTVRGSITTRGISYSPLVMVYGNFERYFNRHHDGVQWVPGETMTVTIEGADVPSGTSAWRYPSRIDHTVTLPALDRKDGGTFRWKTIDMATVNRMPTKIPTDVGKVGVFFPGSPATTCFGPVGSGELAVPGEAIAHIAPGSVSVRIETLEWGHLRAGGYFIYLEAREEHQTFTVQVR
jgi:hypothetical protein